MAEEDDKRRDDFLIAMYNQLWGNINRHINLVWQPVSLLITTFGLLFLGEKGLIDFNVSVSLVILFSGWFIAHVYDTSHWYNRNLKIISNIERQFLRDNDEKEIHYFFKKDFDEERMITHLRLQLFLGIGILITIVLFYIIRTIELINSELLLINVWKEEFICMRGLFGNIQSFIEIGTVWLPIASLTGVIIGLHRFRQEKLKNYKDLIRESPGKK